MYNRMLSVLSVLAVLATSCFRLPNNSPGQSSLRSKQRLTDTTEAAKTFVRYDPKSEETLTVSASATESLAGSKVQVAPGSLKISTTLVIEPGVPLSDTSVTSEIGLSDDIQIKNASNGFIVRPSENVSLKSPLKISLPLPATGLRLAEDSYVVYAKYLDPSSEQLVTEAIPVDNTNASVTYDANLQKDVVQFDGYFGSYWVASVSRPVEATEVPPPKPTQEPIINQNQTTVIAATGVVAEATVVTIQPLESPVLGKVTMTYADAERKIYLHVDSVSGFKTCSVDVYEKSSNLNGKSYDVGLVFDYSVAITKTTAHTLTGRFRCLDTNSKSVTSPWSDPLAIPAYSSTPPLVTLAGYPTGVSSTKVLDVTVTGADITFYKSRIVASGASCATSSGYSDPARVVTHITTSLAAMSDGSYDLCVIGQNSAGVWQAEANATKVSWTKDTTAPLAVVTGAPSGLNAVSTLSVTVSGTDVTHYKYKLRLAADPACSLPSNYSSEIAVTVPIADSLGSLGDGVVELCVIGRDAVGNWQAEASAIISSWTKDTLPPMADISNNPSGTSTALALNVTVGGSDTVQYKYKIREAADPLCSVSANYSGPFAVATPITNSLSSYADGALQLCVIGQDTAGTWQLEGTATIASWTKDTTAPNASLSGAPSGTSNSTTLNVTVSGTDVSHYKYKIRGSSDSACSVGTGYSGEITVGTPITASLSSMSDGTVELCVLGRDAAGNYQGTASKASWTKDTSAPTATLIGPPTGTNNTTVLNITVAGTGVSHYKFKLRQSSDPACSNTSGYGSEIPVATPITSDISGMADGTIQICVIGRDSVDNWQTEASAATASWTKDALPPVSVLTGEPNGTDAGLSLNVTVSGPDVVEYKYKIRESADTLCSNSTGYSAATAVATPITNSLSSYADGTLQLCVIGKDAGGNWQLEGTATIASWTKDTTAPTASINGEPSGQSNFDTLSVSISGTDVSHYKYKIRGTADSACSVSSGYSSEVAVATSITDSITSKPDGAIELCVIGRDTAGNWQGEASASTVTWTKDTTAPTSSISGQPSGFSLSAILNVNVFGSDVTHYKFKIRESADAPCSDVSGYSAEVAVATPITSDISALSDGAFQLCVIGRDVSSNWQSPASATTASWTKDTSAPTAILSGPPTGTNLETTLNVTVAGTDVVSYKYKIRQTADAACSNSSGYGSAVAVATPITDSISAQPDGVFELCVLGMDAAGNLQAPASATTASWTKDTTPPSATITDAPTGMSLTTTLNITMGGTGATQFKYKIRDSAATACSVATGYSAASPSTLITDSISAFADGAMEVCVVASDAAGNWQAFGAATSATWTKDTAPPTATISGEPTGKSAVTGLNVTIAGSSVIAYKYKVRAGAEPACSVPTGYSLATGVATPITDSIAGKPEGTLELCVIGRDSAGNFQSEASATIASWTKDALLPTVPVQFAASPRETSVRLKWASGGGDVTGFLVLRQANTAVSTTPSSAVPYSAGNTISTATVAYSGPATSFTDTGLTLGTKYYYKVFAYDFSYNYTTGLASSARPINFEPPAADDLLLWTDVSYIDSMFTDNACSLNVTTADETVACWKDISLNPFPVIQTTSINRPAYKPTSIFGRPGLRFSDNQFLAAPSSPIPSGNLQHTLVYIGSFTNTVTSGSIHIGGTSPDSMIKMTGDSGMINYAFGSNDIYYPVTSTSPNLFIGTYNGINGTDSNRKFYTNNSVVALGGNTGVLTNTLNLPSNPQITIGSDSTGSTSLTGDIGEYLLYNKELSLSERIELSRYAWEKWNIPQIEVQTTSKKTSIVLDWKDGLQSSSYLLVVKAGSPPTFAPTDGTPYTTGVQGSDSIVYAGTAKTYTLTSLTEGTTYYFALYGNDGSNRYSPVVGTSAKPLQTPTLNASPGDSQIQLSWAAVPEATGYLLTRRSSSPTSWTPTDGIAYSPGVQGTDTIRYKGTATTFLDTGIANGTTFHYKLYAYDGANYYATGTTVSAAPVSSCPTGPTPYLSNGSVTVPAGCSNVTIEAWGGGGGGGSGNSYTSGAGGAGGKTVWSGSALLSPTITWIIGQGGACGANQTGGTGSVEGTSASTGSGGAGGNATSGSNGLGAVSGGAGSSSISGSNAYAGGNGKYGGGGGGGGSNGSGGGGGGATAVSMGGTVRAIAGGGGGGAGAGNSPGGGMGGGGCSQAGSGGATGSGGGGGGGACLGTTNTTGGGAAGGGTSNTTGCTNNGSPGKVIITYSP